MTSANAAKGKRFELAVVRYLEEVFNRSANRPRQEGHADVGDVHLSPFVLQCKDYADIATGIRAGVAGAELQAPRAGEPFGVAVVKYRGKGVSEARVAMSLHTFRRLVARMRAFELYLAALDPDLATRIRADLEKEIP